MFDLFKQLMSETKVVLYN